jgi:DNA-binding NtrC family response regulator
MKKNFSNTPSLKLNLLIAEDEELLREILVDSLQGLNCEIFQAENGEVALEMLKAKANVDPISAVLTDINMPKKNGFEFMEGALKAGFKIPFIFLTAYGDKDNVVRALRLGAFDFLEKPFNQENLMEVLRRALEVGSESLTIENHLTDLFQKSGLPESQRKDFIESKRAIETMRIENRSLKTRSQKKSA